MKILLALSVTIFAIAALLIKPLRRHRWKIMGAYAILVICLFALYNIRNRNLILTFLNPTNQLFYQPEFAEGDEKLYPDALLTYLLEGKEVYVPAYVAWDDVDASSDEVWENGQMLCINFMNILRSNGADIQVGENYDILDGESVRDEFDDLGPLNDTFRYSFFYNNLTGEYGNGFYYYWFYGANSNPFNLYVYKNGTDKADKLVALFDGSMNIYLAPYEFYEKAKGE